MDVIVVKRIYDEFDCEDGYRILVDRIWPRGVSKLKAHLDDWVKEIAPSEELRKKFHNEKIKWPEFKRDYLKELKNSPSVYIFIKALKDNPKITLVYGAKDTKHNNAVVLKSFLEEKLE